MQAQNTCFIYFYNKLRLHSGSATISISQRKKRQHRSRLGGLSYQIVDTILTEKSGVSHMIIGFSSVIIGFTYVITYEKDAVHVKRKQINQSHPEKLKRASAHVKICET